MDLFRTIQKLLTLHNINVFHCFFHLSKSLFDIVSKINQMTNSGKLGSTVKQSSLVTSSTGGIKRLQEKPFDAMNNIVANLLLNLTR